MVCGTYIPPNSSHRSDRATLPSVRILHTIPVPWTPYAVTFSRDGKRLAIGGGTYMGNGGIIIRNLSDGAEEPLRWQDYLDTPLLFPDVRPYLDPVTGGPLDALTLLRFHLRAASQAGATSREALTAFMRRFGPNLRWSGIPTISSLAFSDDDQLLAASIMTCGRGWLPPMILNVDGTRLTLRTLFTEERRPYDFHNGILFHGNRLIVRRDTRLGDSRGPFSVHSLSPELNAASGRFDHLTHTHLIVRADSAITPTVGRSRLQGGYCLAVLGWDGTSSNQMLRGRATAINNTPGAGFITGGSRRTGPVDLERSMAG
jgi:hypothetical protein